MDTKSRELTVQVALTLKVGYDPEDLEKMDKTFREFKHGVERVVRDRALPDFQADPHCDVTVLTVGFPTKRKLKMAKKGQMKLET